MNQTLEAPKRGDLPRTDRPRTRRTPPSDGPLDNQSPIGNQATASAASTSQEPPPRPRTDRKPQNLPHRHAGTATTTTRPIGQQDRVGGGPRRSRRQRCASPAAGWSAS